MPVSEPLSEHEQKLWSRLTGQLRSDKNLVKADKEHGRKHRQNGRHGRSQRLPRTLHWLPAGVALSAVLIAGLSVSENVSHNKAEEQDKLVLRNGVEIALSDVDILAITGTCAIELAQRADEVDAILMNGSEAERKSYGAGPTALDFYRAAGRAVIYQTPCEPASPDAAYTLPVDGVPVTLQQADILWTEQRSVR